MTLRANMTFFAVSISRKFRIFSRNRLKHNFAKKAKIFRIFRERTKCENEAKWTRKSIFCEKFSRNDFSFSLETFVTFLPRKYRVFSWNCTCSPFIIIHYRINIYLKIKHILHSFTFFKRYYFFIFGALFPHSENNLF